MSDTMATFGASSIPDPFTPPATAAAPESTAPAEPDANEPRTGGPRKGSSWSPARRAAQAARKRAAGSGSAPKKTTAAKRPGAVKAAQDPRPAIMAGLRMLVAMPLMSMGKKRQSDALISDGAAVAIMAEPIATATAKYLATEARFTRLMGGLVKAGPLAELGEALTALAVQCAANHSIIPAAMAASMGAMTTAELDAAYDAMTQAA